MRKRNDEMIVSELVPLSDLLRRASTPHLSLLTKKDLTPIKSFSFAFFSHFSKAQYDTEEVISEQ